MEKLTSIKKILNEKLVGKEVLLGGWIRSLRKSKKFSFLRINDGSNQDGLQVIVDGTLDNYHEIVKMNSGSSCMLRGKIVESGGKNQSLEMHALEVIIVGAVSKNYPLQKKATSLEFLREVSHLRPRTNTFGAVFRIRHALSVATHKFFDERDFYYMHAPIITASDCEGAGEMFRVTTLKQGETDNSLDYFGKPTFLTVSGQLSAEAFCLGLGKVYTFGPTFRSENSNTSRHLSEFWMIEPEIAFADLSDAADLASDYIKFLCAYVLENYAEELQFLSGFTEKDLVKRVTLVRDSEFKKITYTEAIEVLQKTEQSNNKKFNFPIEWGLDLQTEHERFLSEEHFNSPVIVTDYPKGIKAFYMKQNEDGKTVRAMDLLVPEIGELIGGAQREDDLSLLQSRMKELNLSEDEYWWYLELRSMGGCPHSGFGLGFERMVMYVTGMNNIRDVIPFARTPKNVEF